MTRPLPSCPHVMVNQPNIPWFLRDHSSASVAKEQEENSPDSPKRKKKGKGVSLTVCFNLFLFFLPSFFVQSSNVQKRLFVGATSSSGS